MGRFKVVAGENDTVIVGREAVTIPAGYYESVQSFIDAALERQRFCIALLGRPSHPKPAPGGYRHTFNPKGRP